MKASLERESTLSHKQQPTLNNSIQQHYKIMNNVQAGQQFNALQKATATYNNDAKMADHMRRRETDLMNRAAEQIRLDEEEFRIVHGVVGEEERKRKNLEAEIKRYREGIEADKKESIAVVSETTGKEVSVVL